MPLQTAGAAAQAAGPSVAAPPGPHRAARRPLGLSLAGLAAVVTQAGGRDVVAGKSDAWLQECCYAERVAAAGGRTALMGKKEPWLTEHGLGPVVAAAGGLDALLGTTEWLKQNHVKPFTAAKRASYAELLSALPNGAELVGPATHFLSHAYAMPFLFSVDAAAAWAARNPDGAPHFFYFDLLSVNQHGQNMGVTPEVLWEEFAGGVLSVGHTLLVLTYDNPLPLTRAWCLAEIVTGLGEAGGKFEVVLPPEEESKFRAALVHDFYSIESKTCNVDLKLATAWHGGECLVGGVCRNVASGEVSVCTNDLQFVRDAVEREMGFFEANKRVIGRMRQWMLGAGRAALDELPAIQRPLSTLINHVGRLLHACGEVPEAEALYREELEGTVRARGRAHPSALYAITGLASVLHARGALSEALPLYREALEGWRIELGSEEHPTTLGAASNVATVLTDMGEFGEAEPLMRRVCVAKRRVLGPLDPSTLGSIGGLARALEGLKRLPEALPFFREALSLKRHVLTDAHPDTLNAMNSLAGALAARGCLCEAESLYREALSGRRRTLGDSHPDTLDSLSNLAAFLTRPFMQEFSLKGLSDEEELFFSRHSQKDPFREAELLLREALDVYRRGNRDPATFIAVINLARCLLNSGNDRGAVLVCVEALEVFRRPLVSARLDAVEAIGNLGNQLCIAGRLGEAEPLLREALGGILRLRGGAHPFATGILSNLVTTLYSLDRPSEAKALLRDARSWSCEHCDKANPPLRCSACRLAHYCNAQCQRAGWPAHKPDCLRKRGGK